MTTDLFRTVRAEDGFGADPDDFNAAQRTGLARMMDQLLAKLAPNVTTSDLDFEDLNTANIPAGPWAYALTGGGARPIQGSANNKIKISNGTLFQKIAATDGNEAQLIPYTFDGTDEVTIADGDVANPRVDLVQMKLEWIDDTNTSRDFEDAVTRAKTTSTTDIAHRVQCTLSVKQGTPAASPTYPALDAGYVAIAGVVVGTSYVHAAGLKWVDTPGAVAVLHDQRMPLGMEPTLVMPSAFGYPTATWALDATNRASILASGTPGEVQIACPHGGRAGRLTGFRVVLKSASAPSINLAWYAVTDDGSGNCVTSTTVTNGAGVSADATVRDHVGQLALWEGLHSPIAGPTVQQSVAGLGVPMWTSGMRCPFPAGGEAGLPAPFAAGPISLHAAALKLSGTSAGCIVGPAMFFVARGL